MIDRNRLNGIFFAAFALYLASTTVQLHAKQLSWHGGPGVSLHAVGAAIERGIVEAVKLQGDANTFPIPVN